MVNLRHLNPLPQLFLPSPVTPRKPAIPLVHELLQPRQLLRSRNASHQLRLSKRQFIPAIDLPEMIRLAVQLDHLLHLGGLGLAPQRLRDEGRRLGHDQHARLDLEHVTVPQAALVLGQRVVHVRLDHVLDTDQAGAGRRAVVEQALPHVFGQVAAVVVCLDDPGWVGGVDVKGVEVSADAFERGEVLGLSASLYGLKGKALFFLACVMAAPVSRTALLVLRGSPTTLGSAFRSLA